MISQSQNEPRTRWAWAEASHEHKMLTILSNRPTSGSWRGYSLVFPIMLGHHLKQPPTHQMANDNMVLPIVVISLAITVGQPPAMNPSLSIPSFSIVKVKTIHG